MAQCAWPYAASDIDHELAVFILAHAAPAVAGLPVNALGKNHAHVLTDDSHDSHANASSRTSLPSTANHSSAGSRRTGRAPGRLAAMILG